MEIITLREDYFCCNTYVVIDNGCAVIIDAGVRVETVKSILEKYSNPKVSGILITHAHFDHILGLADYINEFGCDVYIHKKGVENLNDPINNYSAFTDNIIQIKSDKIIALSTNKKLKLDCFDITYLYTPGHTDDAVCYVIDQVMFTGDTIFDRLIGRTDLANSNPSDMQKSIRLLEKAPVYQMYFPGHGRKSEGDTMHKYLEMLIENNDI